MLLFSINRTQDYAMYKFSEEKVATLTPYQPRSLKINVCHNSNLCLRLMETNEKSRN